MLTKLLPTSLLSKGVTVALVLAATIGLAGFSAGCGDDETAGELGAVCGSAQCANDEYCCDDSCGLCVKAEVACEFTCEDM